MNSGTNPSISPNRCQPAAPLRTTRSHRRKLEVGFPIRKYSDQSLFAAPQVLSQRTTSFIASQRQGIHRILLRHLIALIVDARSSTRPLHEREDRDTASIAGRLCKQTAKSIRRGRRHSAEAPSQKDQLLDHARGCRGQAAPTRLRTLMPPIPDLTVWQVPAAKPDMVPLHDVERSRTRTRSHRDRNRVRMSVLSSDGDARHARPRGSDPASRPLQAAEITAIAAAPPRLVEPDGIEPTTSCLQSTRSPN